MFPRTCQSCSERDAQANSTVMTAAGDVNGDSVQVIKETGRVPLDVYLLPAAGPD